MDYKEKKAGKRASGGAEGETCLLLQVTMNRFRSTALPLTYLPILLACLPACHFQHLQLQENTFILKLDSDQIFESLDVNP